MCVLGLRDGIGIIGIELEGEGGIYLKGGNEGRKVWVWRGVDG